MTPKTPFVAFCLLIAAALSPVAGAADSSTQPPKSWIDPDTGHRVIRLTDEPDSASFYFNDNCFTPDGKEMVYTTPQGISVIDLATFKTRPVVVGKVRAIVVGRKTPSIFYINAADNALYSANLDSGEPPRKLADLPAGGTVSTINADETLAAGTRMLSAGSTQRRFTTVDSRGLVQSVDKMEMMERRLAAHYPMEMFTIDLQTGAKKTILQNSDWLNHLQFSPTDPTLLLYCHEGPWWKVDRIWTIRTNGTQNTLIQPRTMEMEASGHEFWSNDGKTIWYDLQLPWGTVFYVAGYNIETGERTWYHLEQTEWSIHYNTTPDQTLFCGDGADDPPGPWATSANKWIYLFRPAVISGAPWKTMSWPYDVRAGEKLVHAGRFQTEKLVNMAKHGYLLEPNPIFTPDSKYIIFRSNMFGPTYVFAVEVAKAN